MRRPIPGDGLPYDFHLEWVDAQNADRSGDRPYDTPYQGEHQWPSKDEQ